MDEPTFRARRVPKPWGHELIWAETDRYAGKMLHVEKGQALSLQYHVRKEETLYVLAGEVELEYGEADEPLRAVRLRAGDGFRITPQLRHRIAAIETSDLLEASTPELDDVVRIEDRYGRAGTSAP